MEWMKQKQGDSCIGTTSSAAWRPASTSPNATYNFTKLAAKDSSALDALTLQMYSFKDVGTEKAELFFRRNSTQGHYFRELLNVPSIPVSPWPCSFEWVAVPTENKGKRSPLPTWKTTLWFPVYGGSTKN